MSANPLMLERILGGWNPKVACGFVLTLVFLCGGVVGALAIDLGVHNRARTPSFETVPGRVAYFDRIQKELALTDEQSKQVESILNDFWQYYRTVLSDARQRVEQVLTPEQKTKFEHILQTPPK
ncbi:MAG: hypothetical protein ABSC23_03420 [Bryobacteraceae bacterium]|jgi:hypothetical protein